MTIFRYADYAPGTGDHFDADVVVVGTGAGGASTGAILAEAGLDVLFCEEGGYHPTGSFNPYMTESMTRLYRDTGTTSILGTPNIPYVEGRCVGGSTTLNGGMAYRAPEAVLDDWAATSGDPTLGPAGMERHFALAEESIHVGPQHAASVGDDNRIMYQGAQKLGWKSAVNQRNQSHCVGTNNCILGCPTGAKQSTLVSYMPRAIRAGARCLTELRVDKLLIEGGRCVGVEGRAVNPRTRAYDRRVRVRARAVVVSGGAVHTPYLLMRHRLRSRELGRNFLCHPNAKVVAQYPFDVRAWQGVSQWSQVREFHGDGIVLAENMIPPGALAATLPWLGREHMAILERYNQTLVTGCLVEDSTTGRVHRGPLGMPVVRYDITDWDLQRFIFGVERLAELHFAMGADHVILPYRSFHVASSMDEVRRGSARSLKKSDLELFTVHLMGTARMGSRPESSVVDLDGQLWELPGCYVSDASVFPTAIGVNPQVTIMALGTRIGERLAEHLTRRRASAAA